MRRLVILCVIMVLVLSMTVCGSYATTEEHNRLDLNESTYTSSEVMTYDELVVYYAEKKDISIKEATEVLKTKGISADNNARATGTRYQVFSQQIKVTNSYKPEIDFYCEVSYWNSYWGIDEIYDVELNRGYNGTSKQFDGSVKYWLRSAYQIEWVINGDFYNNGTTSFTGGGSVQVGDTPVLLYGEVSYSSNHYKYCYQSGLLEVQ